MSEIRTQRQALKAAQKRWGDRAAIREHPSADKAADREAARGRLKAAGPRPRPTGDALDGLARNAWDDATRADRSTIMSYRCTVGYIMPMIGAFLIRGQGDTWAEAFAMADK